MDDDTICGVVKKQSQWGISWNCRYLAVVNNAIHIYKNERVYVMEGQCKYALNFDDIKIEELSSTDTEVKIKVTDKTKHSFKFQLSPTLWASLADLQSKSDNDGEIQSPRQDDETGSEKARVNVVPDDQSA